MKAFKKENINVPIFSWCNEPEEGAIEQAVNLTKLPFIFRHVALMPDTHQGYGMPIGGVIACKDVVVPNAVGMDIGCGMAAVKTNIKSENMTTERVKEIISIIRKTVPVGFKWFDDFDRKKILEHPELFNYFAEKVKHHHIAYQEQERFLKQLGTLGGGNHFIELQKGDDGYIWFMVHSGSRNLGAKIAEHYHNLAKEHCKMRHSQIPNEDLAFLPFNSEAGKDYIIEMNFALLFAQANRDSMVNRIKEAFKKVPCKDCNGNGGTKGQKCDVCNGTVESGEGYKVEFLECINIHHNYAAFEHHFDENVIVHRKGATSARAEQLGIIPGSQGTCSYIVRGLGNPESFMSCSHGAGRKMSRNQAKKKLNLEDEIKKMDDQGIVHGIRNKKDLDEASGAYKDIDVVMEEQKDLVEIVTKLLPIGVVKG